MIELGHHAPTGPNFIGEDNDACLKIVTITQTSFRTRHLRIKFHFIRDAVQRKEIYSERVPSVDNPTGLMTKPFRGHPFVRQRATILHLGD